MGDVVRLTNLTAGGRVHVDVKDGRILRIVPLQLDDTDASLWSSTNDPGMQPEGVTR